jgi:hypothetical protein
MPCVPHDEREAYRVWAKNNFRPQMDERAWVHESAYQDFLLRKYRFDYEGMSGTGILVRLEDDTTSLRYTGEFATQLRNADDATLEAEAEDMAFS